MYFTNYNLITIDMPQSLPPILSSTFSTTAIISQYSILPISMPIGLLENVNQLTKGILICFHLNISLS